MNDTILQCIDRQVELFKKKLPPPSRDLQLLVTIPAKNEEEYLTKTLDALFHQKNLKGESIKKEYYEVLVLCHNCTDNTFIKAINFKNNHPEFNLHILELNSKTINNVGAARRILMHLGVVRLPLEGWIATTDADTIPHNDWVYRIIHQDKNIDMICGKIMVNKKGLPKNVQSLLDAKLKYNQLKTQLENTIVPSVNECLPMHNQNSGPNMALQKQVYIAVDGMPAIPFLEDIELFLRARALGYSIKHDNDIIVETSGRLFSRTEGGFGSELNHWNSNSVTYQVEDIVTLKARFSIYKMIKKLFYRYDESLIESISKSSLIDKTTLQQIYHQSSLYEEMLIQIEKILDIYSTWRKKHPLQNIEEVNHQLSTYLDSLTSSSAKV